MKKNTQANDMEQIFNSTIEENIPKLRKDIPTKTQHRISNKQNQKRNSLLWGISATFKPEERDVGVKKATPVNITR